MDMYDVDYSCGSSMFSLQYLCHLGVLFLFSTPVGMIFRSSGAGEQSNCEETRTTEDREK